MVLDHWESAHIFPRIAAQAASKRRYLAATVSSNSF